MRESYFFIFIRLHNNIKFHFYKQDFHMSQQAEI